MPRHDPPPPARQALRRRWWRAFRLLLVLAMVIGALSADIIARSVGGLHIHMLIATALGTGFTVLVGGGLMTLVFLSAKSGHDADAATPPDQETF
ncbi:MAG: hypothetical protein ABIO29_03420 [Sphingomicrobium sp.]